MIVCSCNVFSDVDVRRCLRSASPPRTVRGVYEWLGCAPNCGVCVDTIRLIVKSEHQLAAEARTARETCAEARSLLGWDANSEGLRP